MISIRLLKTGRSKLILFYFRKQSQETTHADWLKIVFV